MEGVEAGLAASPVFGTTSGAGSFWLTDWPALLLALDDAPPCSSFCFFAGGALEAPPLDSSVRCWPEDPASGVAAVPVRTSSPLGAVGGRHPKGGAMPRKLSMHSEIWVPPVSAEGAAEAASAATTLFQASTTAAALALIAGS